MQSMSKSHPKSDLPEVFEIFRSARAAEVRADAVEEQLVSFNFIRLSNEPERYRCVNIRIYC